LLELLPASGLPFGMAAVEGGPLFGFDVLVTALMCWPQERVLDVDLADGRGVASAGAVDEGLQARWVVADAEMLRSWLFSARTAGSFRT
jgi:hypothetical protein